jgi:hypothetical protein
MWAGSHDHPVPFDQVEAWLLDAARTFTNASIVMDAREGVGMAQRLRTHRLKIEEVPFTMGVTPSSRAPLAPPARASPRPPRRPGHRLALTTHHLLNRPPPRKAELIV